MFAGGTNGGMAGGSVADELGVAVPADAKRSSRAANCKSVSVTIELFGLAEEPVSSAMGVKTGGV